MSSSSPKDAPLTIAGKSFHSRLLLGTGKYRDLAETGEAVAASGAQIVTFAVRRTHLGKGQSEAQFLDVISPQQYTLLPNSAGCYTCEQALRNARLARELLDGYNLTKLEVLGDEKSLYPDIVETVKAAEILVKEGFDVMVYTNDDPIIAKRLENIGCVAVMPLASLIGSGLGICNPHNLKLIVEQAKVPIIVDAGVGTASDATIAMELGCDGVLMNTAVAEARHPVLMASAMKHAVVAGREAYLAGRMAKRYITASASSPSEGMIFN